jgi:hypothetical protein
MSVRPQLWLAATLVALGAVTLPAQVCRGIIAQAPGSFALTYGRAGGGANVRGADIAWRFDQGLLVYADANSSDYPRSDPARGRIAVGVGLEAIERGRFGLCTTVSYERERMQDLLVQRMPIGVALGWATRLAGDARSMGVSLEPFYVHGHERIERFEHASNFISVRAGLVYVVRGLLLGLDHENAFDADARWHTTARIGFTFR